MVPSATFMKGYIRNQKGFSYGDREEPFMVLVSMFISKSVVEEDSERKDTGCNRENSLSVSR